jgi:hypothetical protein
MSAPLLSTLPSRAAIRRDSLGQVSGRLAVRPLRLVSTPVSIVNLDDARTLADALWEGAVASGAQWSARQRHVARLHTLVYQLLSELTARHVRTVAVDLPGGAR